MEPAGSALVTGASRGIGRAVAIELARRGFEVTATLREPARAAGLEAEAPGRIRVSRLDVREPDTIHFPEPLRVLVNNAGLDPAYLPVEHAPLADWREVFETNLFGLVEVTQRAIPALRAAGGGVICNLSSASLFFPMPFFSIYRASKAAVAAFGESLRAELLPFGIRVIEVLPGPIETDMLASSDRMPEAARHDGYRRLAEWAHASRAGVSAATPVSDAARDIVDAILDPDAPHRVACDPLGAAMIAGADAAPFEERLRGALDALARACTSD